MVNFVYYFYFLEDIDTFRQISRTQSKMELFAFDTPVFQMNHHLNHMTTLPNS